MRPPRADGLNRRVGRLGRDAPSSRTRCWTRDHSAALMVSKSALPSCSRSDHASAASSSIGVSGGVRPGPARRNSASVKRRSPAREAPPALPLSGGSDCRGSCPSSSSPCQNAANARSNIKRCSARSMRQVERTARKSSRDSMPVTRSASSASRMRSVETWTPAARSRRPKITTLSARLTSTSRRAPRRPGGLPRVRARGRRRPGT